MDSIIGATIGRIYMDDKHLTFITDKGKFSFTINKTSGVRSFFCDFYGVNHLFGSKILSMESIPVTPKNKKYRNLLPRHRSLMTVIKQRVFTDLRIPLPTLYGYEILTRGVNGGMNTSVFAIQGESETPVPLIPTEDHISEEKYRIFKRQSHVYPSVKSKV